MPLGYLSSNEVEAWKASALALLDTFQKVKDFDPANVENPGSARDESGNAITARFNNLKATTSPQLPYLILKREPVDFKLLKKAAESTAGDIDSKRQEADRMLDEMRQILRSSQTAVAQVGVDTHSVDFSSVAEEHERYARYWLRATVAMISGALLAPLFFILYFPLDPNAPQIVNIQIGLAKITVVFVLFFLISLFLKNYRTHRHLYVINKHRETSLRTFQTFVKGAGEDEQTKLHILMEAARTVFSPVSTGYMPSEDDSPTNRVVEILKTVKDTKT